MASPHSPHDVHGDVSESTAPARAPDHGADGSRPEGLFDYGVIVVSTAIVAVTLYLAVRYLVWPGERSGSHIKRTILDSETYRTGGGDHEPR
jgi:hypothetical protein